MRYPMSRNKSSAERLIYEIREGKIRAGEGHFGRTSDKEPQVSR